MMYNAMLIGIYTVLRKKGRYASAYRPLIILRLLLCRVAICPLINYSFMLGAK